MLLINVIGEVGFFMYPLSKEQFEEFELGEITTIKHPLVNRFTKREVEIFDEPEDEKIKSWDIKISNIIYVGEIEEIAEQLVHAIFPPVYQGRYFAYSSTGIKPSELDARIIGSYGSRFANPCRTSYLMLTFLRRKIGNKPYCLIFRKKL